MPTESSPEGAGIRAPADLNPRTDPPLDFPDAEEEKAILVENLPFSDEAILDYITDFLQSAHDADERFTVRDGINIARYALKQLGDQDEGLAPVLRSAVVRVLGDEALRYLPDLDEQ